MSKIEYDLLMQNKTVRKYMEGLQYLHNTIEQDGGFLNLFYDKNQLIKQYGGGIVDDIKAIIDIINSPKGVMKYSQELDDLGNYLKDRLKSALNPANIKETLSFSFIPVKLVDNKPTIDREHKLVIIFCNFIRKLVKSKDSDSNDKIIDDFFDITKVISNLSEIAVGIFNDLLILADEIVTYLIKNKNEQKGGCVVAGVDTAVCATVIVVVVILCLTSIILLLIIGITVVLGVYAPQISNAVNSLFLTINNLIANLTIVKLHSTDKDSTLAKEYLSKYNVNNAMGSVAKLSDQTLSHTTKLADKGIGVMGEVGKSALQGVTEVGKSALGAVSSTGVVNGISDNIVDVATDVVTDVIESDDKQMGGGELINFIEKLKVEIKKLTNTEYLFNQFMQKLNSINDNPDIFGQLNFKTPLGYPNDIIKKIAKQIYTLIYLQLDTQPELINQVYKAPQQTGGFIIEGAIIAGIGTYVAAKKIDEAINKSPESNPTGFFSGFVRAKQSLAKLPSNKPPESSPYDKLLEDHPKLNKLVDKVIEIDKKNLETISESEQQTEPEQQTEATVETSNKYYFNKYLKYKNKYLELKKLMN